MKRPNILWICSDQQRFDTLGCHGNEWVRTPNLDALGRGGAVFDNAFVQNTVCAPSRASFLTGRYPRTVRLRENGQSIPSGEMTVPRLLAQAGYFCGLSGKLHLSAVNAECCKTSEPRIRDGYHVFDWAHGHAGKHPGNQYQRWLKENGVAYEKRDVPGCPWIETGMPERWHQTAWCFERAMSFIDACAPFDTPWLFSVNPFDPHTPFDPPAEYLERYLPFIDDLPLPGYQEGELENKPVWQRAQHAACHNDNNWNVKTLRPLEMTPRDHRMVRAAYWAMCDLLDAQVGRVVEFLKRRGLFENTIVLYTSDHGEMLGDHGLYYKGPFFYEGAVHVPLIMSWPEGIRPQRVSSLVELVDLAPTLLEAAGAPIAPGMQGRTLMPLLRGETHDARETVYCEYYNSILHNAPRAYATMVRDERYKLVKVHGQRMGELYDLREDPPEQVNHWDDESWREIRLEMTEKLCDRMAFTIDPLPQRESSY